MVHYMAIRVKCSIMIINAPFGEGEVSLSNSAHLSPFNSLDDEALGGGGVGFACQKWKW